MQYALYVDVPPVVARKGDGVWVELESGSGFVQLYLSRHAAYALANLLRKTLDSLPSNITSFDRHG